MNFLLERGVTLTRRPKRLTLHRMSKKSTSNGFRFEHRPIGRPCQTGCSRSRGQERPGGRPNDHSSRGRVQTLDATDPRLIPLVTGRSVNVRAS